ncbi:MAG: hypothetical protein KUG82_07735 [Pseudomonadales bacterium]|nr:hypothetical protein [Pseudomonadales bacterium]
MNKKKQNFQIGVVLALSLSSQVSWADDPAKSPMNMGVVAKADVGISTLDFPAKLDQKLIYTVLTPGMTLTLGRVFLTAKYGFSLSDADVSEEDEVGSANREDIDVSIGYRVTDQIALFGGFHRGETEIDFEPRDFEDDADSFTFTDRYKESGLHLGGSYAWRLGNAGVISATVAYAIFDSDNQFSQAADDEEEGEAPEFDDESGHIKGDSSGFSYGLRWSVALSDKLYYSADWKTNNFKQEVQVETREHEVDETIVHFTMGLNWVLR